MTEKAASNTNKKSSKPGSLAEYYDTAVKKVRETVKPVRDEVRKNVGEAIDVAKGFGKGLKTLYIDVPVEMYKTLTEEEEDKKNGK